jgi:hypothetical protein
MGFRFRERIKILPGLRINLSKGGISASAGRPGLTVNVGDDKVKTTVGLPGSGLSYSYAAKVRFPLLWIVVALAAVAWLLA